MLAWQNLILSGGRLVRRQRGVQYDADDSHDGPIGWKIQREREYINPSK